MTRNERKEYNHIKQYETRHKEWMTYGTTLTIRTDRSNEYKEALHRLYSAWGFHPASVRVDTSWYDENERIIYIYGLTWEDNDGGEHPWTELYTNEERARFQTALA